MNMLRKDGDGLLQAAGRAAWYCCRPLRDAWLPL
jgi:hypothetical protein